ncbi:MAG: type II secretion system minor pseudopilin GspI [Gammaproteobacteria bacterium]|nr:type II secretion system minor pseudopilin GspI [Gammaproteobacteria bacterium]MBQ0775765.1 type II secretion system minor pseudopilin GspI [Gammaproteobacteria bacterium]
MRGKNAGFTLVEVLVAVVVLSLAAVVLANAFGSSAMGFSRMQERTEAWLLASDKLVEMQVYQQWPSVGTQDDKREVDGIEWRIRTRISSGPYPDTRRVDIEVGPEPENGADFYITYSQGSLIGLPFTGTGTGTGTGSGSGASSAGNAQGYSGGDP